MLKPKHIGLMTVIGVLCSSPVIAGVSANLALTSNYMFRGFTQTDEKPALQGGLDWSSENGFYAGTWASNVDQGAEYDLYLGWSKETESTSFDVGFITYEYTDDDFFDGAFRELYLEGGIGALSAKISLGTETFSDSDYIYIEANGSFDLGAVTLNAHAGNFDPDGGDSIFDAVIGISKDFSAVSVALDLSYEDSDDPLNIKDETYIYLTLSKEWDF